MSLTRSVCGPTVTSAVPGIRHRDARDLPSSHAGGKHSAPADPPNGYRLFFGELDFFSLMPN